MNRSPLGRPALYRTYTGREQCCVLLRLSIICVLTKSRLRVVPLFSSGIVERAKRERAWKSPHARKGDTRRSFTKKKNFNIFYLLHSLIRMWNPWLMRTPLCQCLVSCKTHCKVHTFAQSPSPVRIGPSCYQATIEDHCSDKKRPGQYTGLSIYHVCLLNLLYFLIKNSFLFEKHYSVHSITLHSDNYNGHFMTILQWIKPWLLRLALAANVHWWTKLERNSRYSFDPRYRLPNPLSQFFFTLPVDLCLNFCPRHLVSCPLSNFSLIQLYIPLFRIKPFCLLYTIL